MKIRQMIVYMIIGGILAYSFAYFTTSTGLFLIGKGYGSSMYPTIKSNFTRVVCMKMPNYIVGDIVMIKVEPYYYFNQTLNIIVHRIIYANYTEDRYVIKGDNPESRIDIVNKSSIFCKVIWWWDA